jgi:hypothetical protein
MEAVTLTNIPKRELLELCMSNPYPPYRGTGLDMEKIREYQCSLIDEKNKDLSCKTIAVYDDGKIAFILQFYNVKYLSDYFDVPMFNIGNIITSTVDILKNKKFVATAFSSIGVRKGAKSLMSTSIPAENIGAIQSFIEHGFSYREGFINMVASTSNKQLQWKRLVSNDIKIIEIRMALKQDIIKIEEWYSKSQFPSRFVTEERFDSNKAMMLYGKRFREVMESDEIDGDVIVLYADGHPAGAIIQAIDSRLLDSHSIKTNLLSALVSYRQEQYGKIGVEWVNLGANLNNRIMVQCLEELNFKYGSTDISLAMWF